MAKKKISGNFDIQVRKRETPKCYSKYKKERGENPKKCGMCWFAPYCKADKKLPPKDKVVTAADVDAAAIEKEKADLEDQRKTFEKEKADFEEAKKDNSKDPEKKGLFGKKSGE